MLKGLTHAFGQKKPILSLFGLALNNVVDRKETFFKYKSKIFQSPKNRSFLKGLTHAFGQKMPNFSYLDLVKIRLEKMLNNFVEKQETFFGQ